MEFNEWQVDTLRRGLHSYRVLCSDSGGALSWEEVVHRLLLSKHTTLRHSFGGRKKDNPMRAEAMRRFALGLSTFLPYKLADVQRFLIGAGILSKDDLMEDEANAREAMTVHALLANPAEAGERRLKSLSDAYTVVVPGAGDGYLYDLLITSRVLESLVLVEERCRLLANAESKTAKENAIEGVYVRRGYAFPATGQSVLTVILRGYKRSDAVHYTQVAPVIPPVEPGRPLELVRAGIDPKGAASNLPAAAVLSEAGTTSDGTSVYRASSLPGRDSANPSRTVVPDVCPVVRLEPVSRKTTGSRAVKV
jgi:hypothetical protein